MLRLCCWEAGARFGWAKGRRAIQYSFLPRQPKTDPGNGETCSKGGWEIVVCFVSRLSNMKLF